MTLELVVPFEIERQVAERHRPELRALPALPTVALVDNTKARAGELLAAIGAALAEQGVIGDYFVYRKSLNMIPLDDDERDNVVTRADVVISGVGDCGGCTACSVTDALRCLEEGRPAFVVVTERFTELAASTDEAYGLDGLHHLTVEHPIWTRDPEWFASTGKALATEIAEALASA